MGWSEKYKRSIDCDNPKGFSQKAHCAGKKKKSMNEMSNPRIPKKSGQPDKSDKHSDLYTDEDPRGTIHGLGFKDVDTAKASVSKIENSGRSHAHKIQAAIAMEQRARVAGKTSEAAIYRKFINSMKEKTKEMNEEGLRDWFGKSKSKDGKSGWVNVVTGGTCASDESGEGTPKCVSSAKRASMTKAERLSAARRKKAADPGQQQKSGAAKPTYVSTDKPKKKPKKKLKEEMDLQEVKDKKGKGSGTKDACYHKVKSRYSVWPSAYASGALVKCRKVGAANWGTKSESTDALAYDWDTPIYENEKRYCPKCEKMETADECRYGRKFWTLYSAAIDPTFPTVQNYKKYDPNRPHPANEEKDHEYSMARSELSTIISAAKRLKKKMKGEGNIEAWVQSKITKAADYIDTATDYIESGEHNVDEAKKCWPGYEKKGTQKLFGKTYNRCVKKEQFSNWREELAEDWQKVNRQDKTDGLSQKAVDAYRRENPGSKLQTAVTEKNPEGKRAKRRANFCRRMKGMKSKLTSAKTARDPDSRINKALRRWNCN